MVYMLTVYCGKVVPLFFLSISHGKGGQMTSWLSVIGNQ